MKYRSTEAEIIDDFSLGGKDLRKTLDQLATINRWLGGNKITLGGLKQLLKDVPKDKTISIVDLGCGNGDMLRAIAAYGKKNNLTFRLTGIDANAFAVEYARELSAGYTEINYKTVNVLTDEFNTLKADIFLSTLFLHHFSKEEIDILLKQVVSNAGIGIIINDLQRSKIALFLFKVICLFIRNPIIVKDGITSILSSFKKADLIAHNNNLQVAGSSIRWKWAFRYQWIIRK